jgi:hypothetical protein
MYHQVAFSLCPWFLRNLEHADATPLVKGLTADTNMQLQMLLHNKHTQLQLSRAG